MFLLAYINQLYTAFFVLNDASKVCESRDPILLLSQCKVFWEEDKTVPFGLLIVIDHVKCVRKLRAP